MLCGVVCDDVCALAVWVAQVGPLCELCAPGFSLQNHVCVTCEEGSYVQLTGAGVAVLVVGAIAGVIAAIAYYRQKKGLPPPTYEDAILVLSCQCWGERRRAKIAEMDMLRARSRFVGAVCFHGV